MKFIHKFCIIPASTTQKKPSSHITWLITKITQKILGDGDMVIIVLLRQRQHMTYLQKMKQTAVDLALFVDVRGGDKSVVQN